MLTKWVEILFTKILNALCFFYQIIMIEYKSSDQMKNTEKGQGLSEYALILVLVAQQRKTSPPHQFPLLDSEQMCYNIATPAVFLFTFFLLFAH